APRPVRPSKIFPSRSLRLSNIHLSFRVLTPDMGRLPTIVALANRKTAEALFLLALRQAQTPNTPRGASRCGVLALGISLYLCGSRPAVQVRPERSRASSMGEARRSQGTLNADRHRADGRS